MPNHVISRIVISGDKESIAAFIAKAKGDGEWDIYNGLRKLDNKKGVS